MFKQVNLYAYAFFIMVGVALGMAGYAKFLVKPCESVVIKKAKVRNGGTLDIDMDVKRSK